MWTAIRPLNIDSVAYVSRTVRAPDGYPVTEKVCSELKPLEASIAPYLMNVWNDSCPPGALTTEVNIYRNDNSYIRRILAGYCSSAVTHNADSTDSQESSGRIPNTYGPSFAKFAITQKDAATTCPNTNVDATLFIFEKSSALKETSSKIFQLLNDSLPSWEQSGYTPKQYGFMAFDDQGKRKSMKNNFDIQTFLTKLQPTTVNLNYKSTKASRVLDAIYLATQLILVPPMMINVILNQDSAILPLNYNFSLVDKSIQINIFSFSPSGQYSAFPKDERLASLVRQSGGRFMPLQLDDHVVTTNFIKSVFMEKQLVMDERVSDCSSGKNFSFLIDTESQYATLKAVGSSANLKVFDANNVPIQFNGANGVVNLVSSNGVQIFEIDLSKANIAKGQWTASMSTDKGECGLQVRIVGPYTVVPGFSSTNSNDFPMMQLFGARGKKNGAASIMFRLFTQSNGNKTMALNNVKYIGTSVQDQFNESNDNKNWQTMKINSRDATSCTYQYATDVFNLPLNPLVKLVVYGSVGNSQLQRTFYYYQDSDVTRCKNSKPDDFGICQCPQNYIGDFCQTPVCLNGAFESFGICGCVNGYYGDNCEIREFLLSFQHLKKNYYDIFSHNSEAMAHNSASRPYSSSRIHLWTIQIFIFYHRYFTFISVFLDF
ncbi:hypothetical protein WR25_24587 [Diploscapter pachys]|uniref:EGF-like domain-containing protein n=1 Tax=Diploscapter pachys TaxID=2018661 RepID=A0A2A2JBK7_9BILA|nr:hypothetical protein WR25_24587 [Diploscapter pachys]